MLQVIEVEARKVLMSDTILGGISQGCPTSISTLICSGVRIGGFIDLLGWVPLKEDTGASIVTSATGLWNANSCNSPAKLTQQYHKLMIITSKMANLEEKRYVNIVKTPIYLQQSRDDEVVPMMSG